MSLWICRQEAVKTPYYMDVLGIHLFSSQELCYVIYNYPLLVLDDFVDDNLLDFLRNELNLGFLALKIERWLKSSENPDDVLVMILQECDYYTTPEISGFRQHLQAFRKLPHAEFKKKKADSLFAISQFGKARRLYYELLGETDVNPGSGLPAGQLWHNIGTCYARMFYMQKAFQAYQKAFFAARDNRMLEKLYYLTLLDEKLTMDEREASLITPEQKTAWDQKAEQARGNAGQSKTMRELEDLFGRDPIKRQAGMNRLITRWKKEYRSMV